MAYVGFKKLSQKLAAQGGISNPNAVAAAIGRKKYGAKNFQEHAAKGKTFRPKYPKKIPGSYSKKI